VNESLGAPRVTAEGVVGQVATTVVPRYAAPPTFALVPDLSSVARADVAVVGVPFDTTVSYRSGARFGPAHIRASSRLLRPYNPDADAWPFLAQQVVDVGDIACNPFDIDDALIAIEMGVRHTLEIAPRVLVLGGDHTIALPSLRALHAIHGPISVVHFDAHLDTWEGYFGQPFLHGTSFRRAAEEGLLDPEGCVHVGIRGGLYGATDMADDTALGFLAVRAHEIHIDGPGAIIERIRARVADRPAYVSVDIDVLDPAFAPGTGTPEAGGLASWQLLHILRGLAGLRLVGGDIVEVAPAYDHAEITGIAAAHVGYELLSAWSPPLPVANIKTR
jgi:agmatinase